MGLVGIINEHAMVIILIYVQIIQFAAASTNSVSYSVFAQCAASFSLCTLTRCVHDKALYKSTFTLLYLTSTVAANGIVISLVFSRLWLRNDRMLLCELI